jgi:hypothetical protein
VKAKNKKRRKDMDIIFLLAEMVAPFTIAFVSTQ